MRLDMRHTPLQRPSRRTTLTGQGCEIMNKKPDKDNGQNGWLWRCFNCNNHLRMNSKLELRWDNDCLKCCANATNVLKKRIHSTEIDQNQIRTVQYLLLNKLAQIENECNSRDSERGSSEKSLTKPDLFSEKSAESGDNSSDNSEFNESSQVEIVRTPSNFNSTWDDPYRSPPTRPQCVKCAGNMKPIGDSLKCRDCGEEQIGL